MKMLRFALRGGGALAVVLLWTVAAHGGAISTGNSITSFTATIPDGGPYAGNEAIYSSFTANIAKISANPDGAPSHATCPTADTGGCSGDAANFSGSMDLISTVPFSVTIDGTLTGSTAVSGVVDISIDGGLVTKDLPFTVNPGSFSKLVTTGSLPALGVASFTGSLDLTMAAGQTITLPSSFAIYVNATPPASTPEPATAGLLGLGLAAGALALKRARGQRAR